MKIEIDTEKDDWVVLKHVRCILDRILYKETNEELDLPTDLKIPLAVLSRIEEKIGKTVPMEDFQEELLNHNFKRNDAIKVIDSLKKHGMIFEPREGFISRI
jgi:hypothetical protein